MDEMIALRRYYSDTLAVYCHRDGLKAFADR
jgi:hypothetical protein